MKKILLTVMAAFAAATLLAFTAPSALAPEATVELSSTACPALNCKLELSSAQQIFVLLPENVKSSCRGEYAKISRECRLSDNYKYQGVNVRTSGKDGLVNIEFSYAGYTLKVNGTTWEQLDQMFS